MDRLACIRPQLLQGRSLPAQRRLARVFADAWETGVLSPVRLHTGSIYAPVPHETYAAVVMRFYPRDRRGQADHVWRPDLAPTATLLGQYQRRELGWREFARRKRTVTRQGREGLSLNDACCPLSFDRLVGSEVENYNSIV